MKRIYAVIPKDTFESLPLEKQSGIFRVFYPELVAELRMEYLKENKKSVKESAKSFAEELGIKDEPEKESDEDYNQDDFLKDVKK